jgi:hypothetical protein
MDFDVFDIEIALKLTTMILKGNSESATTHALHPPNKYHASMCHISSFNLRVWLKKVSEQHAGFIGVVMSDLEWLFRHPRLTLEMVATVLWDTCDR